MPSLWNRMRWWLRRKREEQELSEEIDAHLAIETRQRVEAGADPTEAEREARRAFGSRARIAEETREVWGWRWLDDLARDARFALRTMAGNRGFAILAVTTLALGIGVNTTIFTLVNSVFLKGLPFKNPHEIVMVGSTQQEAGRGPASYPDFIDLREQSRSFQGLAGFSNMAADLSDGQNPAEQAAGSRITANTFSLLGRQPLLGRDFTPDDEQIGAPKVVLLSHALWRSRYQGDPDIVGQTIRLNLEPHTVVGVMPEGEGFPNGAWLWLPLTPDQNFERRDNRRVDVVGRLADGVTRAQADAEVRALAGNLAEAHPDTNRDVGATVYPFIERVGPIRRVFVVMQGAVGFVLLIACANVANLLLARAIRRTREISMRVALGATRWRIVRQLLVESLTLSFLGGLFGLGLAVAGGRVLWRAVENIGTPPYWLDFAMDYRVFMFFLAACAGAGILFGLAPALQVSKTSVTANLKEGGRGSGPGRRARRLTSILVVGEIALTIVLLAGAGLMIRSFLNIQHMDVGVETDDMLLARISLRSPKYPEPGQRLAFQEQLRARLEALPGFSAMTIASWAPASGAEGSPLQLADRDIADANGQPPQVSRIVVIPGYFQTLGLALMQGRDFNAADGAPGAEAVIVNRPFVDTYWPGENPLGRRIRLSADPDAPWIEVIGVAPLVLQQATNYVLSPRPLVYLPYRQEPTSGFDIIVQIAAPAEPLVASLRNEIHAMDPDLPLFDVRTLEEDLRQRNWPYRVFGSLFVLFAAIALVMAAVGLYGVTAYGVSQRTQEIGLRMALGAGRRDVLWLVMREGIGRIALGLTLGLPAAWGVSRVLGALLVEVTPTDPLTFAAISALLVLVTLAACIMPARRALGLDPGDVLRAE